MTTAERKRIESGPCPDECPACGERMKSYLLQTPRTQEWEVRFYCGHSFAGRES